MPPKKILISLCEFYSWNECHLEDICENIANCWNKPNKNYASCRQFQKTQLFWNSKWFRWLIELKLEIHIFERTPFWIIRPCAFVLLCSFAYLTEKEKYQIGSSTEKSVYHFEIQRVPEKSTVKLWNTRRADLQLCDSQDTFKDSKDWFMIFEFSALQNLRFFLLLFLFFIIIIIAVIVIAIIIIVEKYGAI